MSEVIDTRAWCSTSGCERRQVVDSRKRAERSGGRPGGPTPQAREDERKRLERRREELEIGRKALEVEKGRWEVQLRELDVERRELEATRDEAEAAREKVEATIGDSDSEEYLEQMKAYEQVLLGYAEEFLTGNMKTFMEKYDNFMKETYVRGQAEYNEKMEDIVAGYGVVLWGCDTVQNRMA